MKVKGKGRRRRADVWEREVEEDVKRESAGEERRRERRRQKMNRILSFLRHYADDASLSLSNTNTHTHTQSRCCGTRLFTRALTCAHTHAHSERSVFSSSVHASIIIAPARQSHKHNRFPTEASCVPVARSAEGLIVTITADSLTASLHHLRRHSYDAPVV